MSRSHHNFFVLENLPSPPRPPEQSEANVQSSNKDTHSHNKRNSLFGFNKESIKNRINGMNRLGNWRQLSKLIMEITIIEQLWAYTAEKVDQKGGGFGKF